MKLRTEREITEKWQDKENLPVVSVYYLAYNQEKFVPEAIESFLMQKTDFRYEIVIGEDHSSDNTRFVCEEYAEKYPHIINLLPSEKNLGIIANSFRTLKACRGKYVAFCEGDDYWINENKLQIQVRAMERHPLCNVSFHPAYNIDSESGRRSGISGLICGNAEIISAKEMLERGTGFMPTCCVMLKRDSLCNLKTAGFLERYCYSFFMKFLPAVEGGCLYISEVMTARRYMSEGSYTKKAAGNSQFALDWIIDVNRAFDSCNEMTEFRFSDDIKRIQSKRLFCFLLEKRLPSEKQRAVYMKYGKWLCLRHRMHVMPVFGPLWHRLLWEFKKRTTSILRTMVFWEGVLIWFSGKKPKKKEVKNVIVTGAGFENKGAQAMLFAVMDEMKRIFPDVNIHLLSINRHDFTVGKETYLLDITPWSDRLSSAILHPLNRIFVEDVSEASLKTLKSVLEKADMFIDISGYALSSQWPLVTSFSYIMNIMVAKKYSVPFYILPQSIGPFDYTLRQKILLYPLLYLYLKYPEKIFIREKEGYELAKMFTRSNLQMSADIVLSKRTPYKKEHIFGHDVIQKQVNLGSRAAGFFPNLRVMERTDCEKTYGILYGIIAKVLSAGYAVYLLRHSSEDLEVCRKIKDHFHDSTEVVFLEDDFNVLELEGIMRQFRFIIASRYHSVVHAYRNGVPAMVLGWAEKYRALLGDFGQSAYFVDCREETNEKEITDRVDMLIKSLDSERQTILKRLAEIRRQNDVFGIFRR